LRRAGPLDDAPTYPEALTLLARSARAGKVQAQVALELKANPDTSTGPNALVFGTVTGKQHSPSNVRRMMRNVVERANERLLEAGEAPLPRLTPHSLRRTFASVMFALNVSLPDVMADGGWADSKTPLTVYAHAMRRDDGENGRLRALVEGAQMEGLGTSANSEADAPSDTRAGIGGGVPLLERVCRRWAVLGSNQ
jgi:Phage integrase family